MPRSLAWLIVAACGSSAPTPPAGPPSNAADPAAPRPFRIERAELADCTPATVLKHVAAANAIRCGAFDVDATPAQLAEAVRCIAGAIARHQSFEFQQWVQGVDSRVAMGMLGRISGGDLVVDELVYDSDPCGGGCPEKGHTDVVECATAAPTGSADCIVITRDCFSCAGEHAVASCVEGRSAVSR